MKKILILIALLISVNLFSQIKVLKVVDDMSDLVFYVPSKNILIIEGESGMSISVHLGSKNTFEFLTVTSVGTGSCIEDATLIIQFVNGEKIEAKSWNDFNCEGNSYFNIDNTTLLQNEPLNKIRITNGRTFKSITFVIPDEDKNYFIELFKAIKSGITTTIKDE